MKILITGAAGRIGRTLADGLVPRHQLRLADLHPSYADQPGRMVCDVTKANDAVRAVAGMDAVVHLAGHPNSTDWDVVQSLNVGGTLTMLRAAASAGVRHFVLASSIHVCGLHPADVTLTNDLPPWPDGPYGASKLQGEMLGRYFAEAGGMAVVAMRICSFRAAPSNAREMATWISPGDMVRLVEACLTADVQGFHTIWGVSANSKARIDDGNWHRFGYRPCDDAADHAGRLAGEGVDLDCFSEWPLLGGAFVALARSAN